MQKKLTQDIKNINPRTKVTFPSAFEADKVLKEHFRTFSNSDNSTLTFETNVKISIFFISTPILPKDLKSFVGRSVGRK